MARLIVLDTGPLGLVTNPRESESAEQCRAWLREALLSGDRVVVPEVADYEVRRELIRARRPKGVARLDALAERIGYLPITTAVMRRAAELWAQARAEGRPTSSEAALDCDVILAATAQLAGEEAGLPAIVATTNVGHLGRFVDAREWASLV